MSNTPNYQTPGELFDLMTVAEAAQALHRSEKQLRWMLHTGQAPKSALIAGRRMFRRADVQAYIDAAFEEAH